MCVCVSVYLSVCPSPIVDPKPIDGPRSNSISRVLLKIFRAVFFSFPPNPKIKGSSHEKKIKNIDFLKNDSNDFDYILWVYSTFQAQQYDAIGLPWKKIPEIRKNSF